MDKFENVSVVRVIARTISVLLHPMILPVYFLFFIFNGNTMFAYYTPSEVKWYCYVVTLLALLIMPMASLPLFRHFKLIKDYELNEKQERVYPILVAVACVFIGFWLLGRVNYTNIVQQLYLVMIILLSIFSVITLRWKMSMHMTAMGGLCGFLLIIGSKYPADVRGSFMLMLILAGLLASSRLFLKKHTPLQVYAGFLFGLCFVAGILY